VIKQLGTIKILSYPQELGSPLGVRGKEAGLTILRITDQEITDQITNTIEKIQSLIKLVKNR